MSISKYFSCHHNKAFKTFFGFYVLHNLLHCYSVTLLRVTLLTYLKLVLQSNCCSIIRTQKVRQLSMNVGSGNVCSPSFQFYYTQACKIVCINKEKRLLFKNIDLNFNVFWENSETWFFGREREEVEILQRPIIDVRCTTEGVQTKIRQLQMSEGGGLVLSTLCVEAGSRK